MAFKKGIKSGIYTPINKEKWILTESFDTKGGVIKYRSSWEKRFFIFMDMNNNIVKANSEGIVVPYNNPVTNKVSRYFIDAMMQTKDGNKWLIEIKPLKETRPPIKPKNSSEKSMKNYIKAIETYAINQAKWKAAEEFANNNGMKFTIITEVELGL